MKRPYLFLAIIYATIYFNEGSETSKRAPSGFTGVRGKKSVEDSAFSELKTSVAENDSGQNEMLNGAVREESNPINSFEKRAPSGFLGVRGKKPNAWYYQQELSDGYYKRAPSGFLGVRGKKENVFGEEFYKRVPNGFMGMRGKKEGDTFPVFYETVEEKRTPSGFLGMRGKKEYEDLIEETKRASNAGFFGMRGKKQPGSRSGFFGMRGKKYPYEFRGKFVGVRGKKFSNDFVNNIEVDDLNDQFNRLGENLDLNQLMLLLTENGSWDEDRNLPYNRVEPKRKK